jgi:hypothetical protein
VNENLKDILSGLSTEVDQQKLLEYLQGKLSAEKQHELEEQMLQDDFAADAMEGLQNIKDKQKIQQLVEQLNKDLAKKTEKKKALRRKLELRLEPSMIIAIVVILLLIVVSYFILHKMLHQ